MEKQLKIIQAIQKKYPDCHVGGSIGLFIHGIRLSRLSDKTDIDIIKFFDNIPEDKKEEAESAGTDFDYAFNMNGIKIDIRIDPTQTYETKWFRGIQYRVSTLENIIKWKKTFAENGSEKHEKDLEYILLKEPNLITI